MLTLQPVNARLWVAREDPQRPTLQSVSFGGKCTQPNIIVAVTGTRGHAGRLLRSLFDRHFDDRGGLGVI